MPDAEATPSGMTELKVPAQTEFIGLARRVATSLGGLLGFNLEKIDEISIAVTQACGSVIEAAAEAWGPGPPLRRDDRSARARSHPRAAGARLREPGPLPGPPVPEPRRAAGGHRPGRLPGADQGDRPLRPGPGQRVHDVRHTDDPGRDPALLPRQ